MAKTLIAGIFLAALTIAVAWQQVTIRELRREVSVLSGTAPVTSSEGASSAGTPAPARSIIASRSPSAIRTIVADEGLSSRVSVLEQSVAELNKASEFLMDRGQVPLSAERIVEMQARFLDPNTSVRDRMQALTLLTRNNGLNDTVIQHAFSLINTTTNTWMRDGLVRELGSSTNSLIRDPMMKLASMSTDPRLRENAVRSLRRFLEDPQVESMMWQMMRTEQDPRVQNQLADALRDVPLTPARVADLRTRALADGSSLDERLIAARALQRSGESATEVNAALAQVAQSTQNPQERARIFSAFDGSNDPQVMVPLVNGLQDADANVRREAADALSSFSSDPGVMQWLQYVVQNDTDPRVRREAEQALRERGGQNRGGPERGGPGRGRGEWGGGRN